MEEKKKQIFEILFGLLSEFDRVCRKHSIEYFLDAGTLLGAVRHNGFIPWDDDIDVIMLRGEYEKLNTIAATEFKEPFFWQTPETDEGSLRFFARLRNSNTTSISGHDCMQKMNHGIFMDIFPADYIPNDEHILANEIKKMKIYRGLASGYTKYYSGIGMQRASSKTKLLYALLLPLYKTKVITAKKMYRRCEKMLASWQSKDCDRCGSVYWMEFDPKCHWPKEYLESGAIEHVFEGGNFFIPKEFDKYLTEMYGDYMTPVQAPTGHGELIQEPDIPYSEYISEHTEELLKAWNTYSGQ